MIDEEPVALINGKFFHQRSAGTHRHGTDDLASSRQGIQDTACSTNSQHAPDPDLTSCCIDRRFNEMRTKGVLLVFLGEVTVFDVIFADQFPVLSDIGYRDVAVTCF